MKSVILVLSCLFATYLTCGYEIESGETLRQTTELNRLYDSFAPLDAIIKLSDLYHHANGASGSNEESQQKKTEFLSELDMWANYIAKDTKNPLVYVQLLEKEKEQHYDLEHMINKTLRDMKTRPTPPPPQAQRQPKRMESPKPERPAPERAESSKKSPSSPPQRASRAQKKSHVEGSIDSKRGELNWFLRRPTGAEPQKSSDQQLSIERIVETRLVEPKTEETGNGEESKLDERNYKSGRRQLVEYTYEESEQAFRDQLKDLFQNPMIDLNVVVEALTDGKGVCSFFEYSDKALFSKIAYLLQVFSDRNLLHLMPDQDSQVLAIQKLSRFCEKLRERGSLTEERRNSFLFSALNEQFDKPIAELEPYVSGSREICEPLNRNGHFFVHRFYSNHVFFKDCLIELADRFTTFMNKRDPAKIEKLIEAANSSWLKEAREFIQERIMDNMQTRQNDLKKYFEGRVQALDMLNHVTDESFTLQKILKDRDFAKIEDLLGFVEGKIPPDEYNLMLETNANIETLNKVCNLSNICLNYYTGRLMRSSYGRTPKRARSEYENDKGKKVARLN